MAKYTRDYYYEPYICKKCHFEIYVAPLDEREICRECLQRLNDNKYYRVVSRERDKRNKKEQHRFNMDARKAE